MLDNKPQLKDRYTFDPSKFPLGRNSRSRSGVNKVGWVAKESLGAFFGQRFSSEINSPKVPNKVLPFASQPGPNQIDIEAGQPRAVFRVRPAVGANNVKADESSVDVAAAFDAPFSGTSLGIFIAPVRCCSTAAS